MRRFRNGVEVEIDPPPLDLLVEQVLEWLDTPPGKCPLCGLALGQRKGARLCDRCRHLEGVPRAQWGWCRGRHKVATTQRDRAGQWCCLRCQRMTPPVRG